MITEAPSPSKSELGELWSYLTRQEQDEIDQLLKPDVPSLQDFIRQVNPSLLAFEHIPPLVRVLQRVADGHLRRLIVLMPPRYFKSELISRLLPAYYLTLHADRWAGVTSYGASLAWELSGEARTYFEQAGGRLDADASSKRLWRTTDGGGMWADGVGGALLGRGYHLGIIDDPVKPEEAHSLTYQRKFQAWYPSKFLSRQEPAAAIVVVMQRLGIEDPVQYLFDREAEAPEHWHVVCCDEIHDAEPYGIPETCTLEPDERAPGDMLAPSRYDRKAAEHLHATAGPYVANAQRQQRPEALAGDFWHEDWFINLYDTLPEDAYNGGKDWDTAYTKDEANSASAYVESYRGLGAPEDFPIYIEDCDFRHLEFPELTAWMRSAKGPHHVEQKASGKSAAQTLRREGIPTREVSIKGDKFARASGVQPVVSQGRVHVRRSVVERLLRSEQGLLRVTAEALVTSSGHLDLNDAFVQAITRHHKRAPSPGLVATSR